MFLVKNHVVLSNDCGFLQNDNIRLFKGFKKIIMEQNEEYLEYIKNEKESIIEKILNR